MTGSIAPRLIEMLNRGLQQGPMSLVSAAAGFGKTTLVSSWLESLIAGRGGVTPPLPAAWLSLDENDSDLVVFLRYFVAAIRTLFPESCTETFALLEAPQPASQAPLLVALSNEIERLPARVVLVLDDYYAIRGETVHDFLSELMRHWPQRLHLVLISRNSPPLPLVSLRAKGLIIEIRTRDLRFTPEESAAYIRRALPAPLEPRAVAMLQERTEGWVAGLHLAILSWHATEDADRILPDLTAAGSGIADYLADEVLAHQPPAIRSFLLKTSILNRLCAELCEAVVEGEGADFDMRACMDWLERADLFFIPLDNRRRWYRYHHLWRDLLEQRFLAELGPSQVNAQHRRAAIRFASHGSVDEGLRHALAAADLDLAARLIEQGLRDALNRADRSVLDRWLRLLPGDFVERRPWLLVIKALAGAFSWQVDGVGKWCRQAVTLIDDEGEAISPGSDLKLLHGNIAMLRGLVAYACNQHVQAIAHTQEALELLPREWAYTRGGAKLFLGLSMQSIGQGAAAERLLLDEYQSLLEKTDAYALWLLYTVSFNALHDDRLAQARLTAEIMLQQATRSGLVSLLGGAYYCLGMAHYLGHDLDAAAQCFGKIAEQPYAYYVLTARDGLMGMVLTHQARGERAAAWQMLERLSQFDADQLGLEHEETRVLRAYLFMTQGDIDSACQWADTVAATIADRSFMSSLDTHLIRARILLARGTPADVAAAVDIVDTLYELAERTHNARFRIALLALQSLLFDTQGRSDAAYAALQQAIALAQPGGVIQSFVDLGPAMQDLLTRFAQQELATQELAAQGPTGRAIRRILAAFPEPREKIETGDAESRSRAANAKLDERLVEPLVEPLTNREQDVLALLRERLSNKEIAHMLGLSPMTVKRHIANLYGKLGVNRRRDAVIKAEALKILPPR